MKNKKRPSKDGKVKQKIALKFNAIINSNDCLTENISSNEIIKIKQRWINWRLQQKSISLHDEIYEVVFMLWTQKYGTLSETDIEIAHTTATNIETIMIANQTIKLTKQTEALTKAAMGVTLFSLVMCLAAIAILVVRFVIF